MQVSRQDPVVGAGRINQKRRTRAAIVAAAEELLAAGSTPTVAEAAERALVSRATAYRYFPTQESLLIELSVNIDVSGIEALMARPVDRTEVEARLLELFEALNRHVLDDEVRYRTALRFYLDQGLSAARAGEVPVVRAGRRTRWIRELLRPLEGERSREELHRLESALSLVTGVEAIVVLRDVCGLEADEALAVTRFAAEAILQHVASVS